MSDEDKVQLKMVAGSTYACPPALGAEVLVNKGDTITVSAKFAKVLLEDGYNDVSNNFHPYFKKVAPITEVDDTEPEGDSSPEPAPKRRSRQAT